MFSYVLLQNKMKFHELRKYEKFSIENLKSDMDIIYHLTFGIFVNWVICFDI